MISVAVPVAWHWIAWAGACLSPQVAEYSPGSAPHTCCPTKKACCRIWNQNKRIQLRTFREIETKFRTAKFCFAKFRSISIHLVITAYLFKNTSEVGYLDLKGLDGLAELCLETLLIKGPAGGCAGQLLLPGVNTARQSPIDDGSWLALLTQIIKGWINFFVFFLDLFSV
jgi:hypothetical protein